MRPPRARAPRLRALDRLSERAGGPPTYGNRADVLAGGRTAFESMLRSVDAARQSLAVEMYTWADDRVGRRFGEAARAALRRGVRVFVLVDSFGSFESDDLVHSVEAAGAEVHWFHPLAPWVPSWYPNRRNHRKLLLVDGTVGFVGGMNLAEEYSEEFRGSAAWSDVAVRVEGPAVRELAQLFLQTWWRCGGSPSAAGELLRAPRETGAAGVQVIGARGLRGRRGLRRYYLALIAMARGRIFLANGYFAPERLLRRALMRAARRRVRVEILVPGPTDFPVVRWAGRAHYGALMAAGVRIFEATRRVLHAKIAVVDDEVLLAGSANLDHRSFRHNLEVAVNVFDRDAAGAAVGALEEDLAAAKEVTPQDWSRRPPLHRLQERLASLVRYWL